MSESLVVCDVAEDLVEKLRKFRFLKETHNAAILMKIDKDKHLLLLDEELEGISPDKPKVNYLSGNLASWCIVVNINMMMDEFLTLCAVFSPVLLGASLRIR